ncbi:MAG: hypothetical protein H0T46_15785 [Deltaproteobacteria bacterium]|nr:hypothetical protein [Deltaproteobacteria bacterium]
MLRTTLLAIALSFVGCHRDPKPTTPQDGELPPLPPASGTPVGYLIDSSSQLKLRDEQIEQLKKIDTSLSARNDALDTQLREIERPQEDPEQAPKKGEPPPKPKDWAPGATPVHTTSDSGKLHEAKAANNRDALQKAFAILDPDQQTAARKLLDDRGITSPGASSKPVSNDAAGVPHEP